MNIHFIHDNIVSINITFYFSYNNIYSIHKFELKHYLNILIQYSYK